MGGSISLGSGPEKEYEFDWARSGHTDFHPFVLDDLDAVLESVGTRRYILQWIWM